MSNEWIENTGDYPLGLDPDTKVQTYWSDGTKGLYIAHRICWSKYGVHCTHWRTSSTLTLDNAYDKPANVFEYPKTNYQPPNNPDKSNNFARVAESINILYNTNIDSNIVEQIVYLLKTLEK